VVVALFIMTGVPITILVIGNLAIKLTYSINNNKIKGLIDEKVDINELNFFQANFVKETNTKKSLDKFQFVTFCLIRGKLVDINHVNYVINKFDRLRAESSTCQEEPDLRVAFDSILRQDFYNNSNKASNYELVGKTVDITDNEYVKNPIAINITSNDDTLEK